MKAAPILCLALLAGCTDSAPPANQAQPARSGVDYARAVIALPAKQRNTVLFKAINDAGLICPNVDSSVRVDSPDTRPRWRAHCSNDTDHLVEVAPDGTGTVISRTDP